MRLIFGLILFIIVQVSFAQVTFVISQLPETHDYEQSIYISGSFEGWTGGKNYKLEQSDKQYSITLPKDICNIQFKFTLGSWDTVERNEKGAHIDNRSFSCSGNPESVPIKIQNWIEKEAEKVASTVRGNVHILSEEFAIPQLNRKRKVWVYLPPDYNKSNENYPVLYMQDAQNIFDTETSYAGEWNVDETLNKLFIETGFKVIVIGIDNGQDKRLNEYSPWSNPRYGDAEGDQYVDFIVKNLKPYVDKTYRTLSDTENTAIMGSSMGGLISFYATLKYPNVFGKAGVLSPSFWYSNRSFEFAKQQSKLNDTKIYFLAGDNEGEHMVSDMEKMAKLMVKSGFIADNIHKKVVVGGQHNEKLWRENFEETISWLFNIEKPLVKYDQLIFNNITGGALARIENFQSKFVKQRTVDVFLPQDYSKDKKYSVLYMHDGQMLFDDTTTWNKQEWKVDEWVSKLVGEKRAKEVIVVAMHNISDIRHSDYFPNKPFQSLVSKDSIMEQSKRGDNPLFKEAVNSDNYLKFIVDEVKPYIDSNYSVHTNQENTFIAGSSMGGLISMYAICEYPNVFGGAACLSTHWPGIMPTENNPVPEAFFKYMEATIPAPENHKFYFDYGTETLDAFYPQYADKVDAIFHNKGYDSSNFLNLKFQDTDHSENSWNKRLDVPLLFLLDNDEPREFVGIAQTDYGLNIEVSDGQYIIKFYTPEIVETTFIPENQEYHGESHAVVLEPSHVNLNHSKVENFSKASSDGLEIIIQEKPFQISYSYKSKPITSERKGYHKTEYGEAIQLNLTEDEVLYGGGARALGMNRRGNRLQLYNKAHYGYETESALMNYTLPIVISSNQYMIHFDNAPIGFLDLDSRGDHTLTYETISGRKTYQVIVGDSWLDLIDNYTELTGKQPLPPRWAFGNFSSRFGYHSQEETERTIDKFKEENIPVDAIILDLYWFGKEVQGTMGNLEVFRDSFPDFEGMVKRLNAKGVKTVAITEPFVLTTSKRWEEAVQADVLAKDAYGNPFKYDFYFGNTGLIDIYKPEGERWFWNIYKDEIISKGVKGIWGDLGEPEVHPSELIHATGTADEVHNIYGHDWARLVYEGYQRDFPNQRPFILMRAGYSGSQRFGLIPWSGDVNRSWGGLQSQTEIALQMAMQGLAYMHSDLGGFAGANLDDELYTRWLQYGVFQPIYRPHAQEEVPSEPVFRADRTKKLAKQSIELRYKLLPYNYTLAFENNQTGKPLMCPVFFEEPESMEQLVNASTYLWGHNFLVTPIVNPGVKEKEVYFPKNSTWFDFYTDEQINGGQTKEVITKENSIPTYVRAGAFIPMAKLVQTTDDYDADRLDLHYYYHVSASESTGQLYNDDGLTPYAFENGNYELLKFNGKTSKKKINIAFSTQTGSKFKAGNKIIDLIIHNIDKAPKRVIINRKRVASNWNSSTRCLSIPYNWNTTNKSEIEITLNNK